MAVHPTFDGANLLIILPAEGAAWTLDVGGDLYSEWKEYVLGTGHQYHPAFRTTGGDPLTGTLNAGSNFFLRNDLGWRIRPAEEDSTITVTGNLFPEDITQPMIVPTTGGFTVLMAGLQPVTQNVASQNIRDAMQLDTTDGEAGLDTKINNTFAVAAAGL